VIAETHFPDGLEVFRGKSKRATTRCFKQQNYSKRAKFSHHCKASPKLMLTPLWISIEQISISSPLLIYSSDSTFFALDTTFSPAKVDLVSTYGDMRGAEPPLDFLAVCFILAMIVAETYGTENMHMSLSIINVIVMESPVLSDSMVKSVNTELDVVFSK
jgi:FtsH-binding integral membrane protein